MSDCIEQPRAMIIECPSCGDDMEVRHSEQLGATLRRLYFCCEACGYRSPANFEIRFSLSPPAASTRSVGLTLVADAPELRGPVNSRTTKRLRRVT
ncbi:ogr/Delta-like zinc finger family protein [Burkholderia gladioli]|uniref:ogr/Delta-like zinc finger family protein n=1 Tax=Burkholderia gladioli TaxID=28095 RepID=UPI001FC8AE3C|nr:ogr/Delta-like zinc finger family protein [Burkholderia gladioli]